VQEKRRIGARRQLRLDLRQRRRLGRRQRRRNRVLGGRVGERIIGELAPLGGDEARLDERARLLAGARVGLAQRRQGDGPGGGDAVVCRAEAIQ